MLLKDLRSWKAEIRGKTEFESARNIIKATYKTRDAIHRFRVPVVFSSEWPPHLPEGFNRGSAEEIAEGWSYVYANRRVQIIDALTEFESHALEAEVLWGNGIRNKTDEMFACARDLRLATDEVINDHRLSGRSFNEDRQLGVNMRSIVSGSYTDEKNVFSQKLAKAVEAIEVEIRPHFRRT